MEETRTACSETRANPYNDDETLHVSQELETVHRETFRHALELVAGDELPDNVNGRSTGELKKIMREMNNQSPYLFPIEITEAMCGVTIALKSVVEHIQRESTAIYSVKNQNGIGEPIKAVL